MLDDFSLYFHIIIIPSATEKYYYSKKIIFNPNPNPKIILVATENFKGSRFTPDSIIPRASLGQRITDNYIEHIYTY